jgi:hypothetical protein
MKRLLVLCLFTAVAAVANDKTYEDGKLLSWAYVSHGSTSTTRPAKDYGNGVTSKAHTTTTEDRVRSYRIQVGKTIYTVEGGNSMWKSAPIKDGNVGQVFKVRIEKHTLYTPTEKGKEAKYAITSVEAAE